MKNRPIGIFDSGVGGLTVLKELDMALPGENYLYFGDTARVPYGEKTPEQLHCYVREIMEWFKKNNVKAVAMACNSSSAVVYESTRNDWNFPVFNLIEPTARYISYLNVSKIGVIATSATVNSKAYTKNIKTANSSIEVLETACPGLVEIVEGNKTGTQEARKLIIKYILPMLEKGVEKIVLGCTHYPFLSHVIEDITGDREMLINPARYLADDLSGALLRMGLVNEQKNGQKQFFASSNTDMFKEAGRKFYDNIEEVSELDLTGKADAEKEMREHLVIIGGVAAGTKAASKARREKPELKITLYTDEKYISYSACGMPYYIQGIIPTEKRLLVRSPEEFKTGENIDIHLLHRVTKIMPRKNSVAVKNLETGEEFEDEYTNLLIATGSRSIVPELEGVDNSRVYKLKTIEDAIKIKEAVKTAKKAVIVGGGYIGVEMAEAFHALGIKTTIIERSSHVLGTFDPDLAYQVQRHIGEKGVKVLTNTDASGELAEIKEADIIIMAVGVRPNVELAKEAGIEIGETGAVKVNARMQTSIPNIYAAGDCAESINRITRKPAWVPLGSTANKQGRIAAMNITGDYAEFGGILGSLVVKVFDYTASKTGLSEKEARQLGCEYEIAIVPHRDRSGYMPESRDIIIKLIAEKGTGRLLGIQAVGEGDADKRVNTVASAITANMTVSEFIHTDLTYAPPYSPAIDPLLVAAQILRNKIKKQVTSISPQELQKFSEARVIDIRNLSTEELTRKILKDSPGGVFLCCDKGMRSYLETLKLREKGCNDIGFVDGGTNLL